MNAQELVELSSAGTGPVGAPFMIPGLTADGVGGYQYRNVGVGGVCQQAGWYIAFNASSFLGFQLPLLTVQYLDVGAAMTQYGTSWIWIGA